LTDAKARRLQRKIDKQRETEARWLQKMLFALSKAKEAREKLADATGEELNPLIELDDGTQVSLDALDEIVNKRVEALMDALGQGVYGRR
jgi:phage shock protein A